MLNNQNLTQEQLNLYYQLKNAIQIRKSITNILRATSGNDLLAVFTTTDTKQYENLKHTFTLLGVAINRNDKKCVDSILTHSKNHGILRDILFAENTLHYIEENSTYTLTPLGLAIHRDHGSHINSNQKYIDLILMKAQEDGVLQEVLNVKNTLHYIEENSTYTLTPLGLVIHQDRDEYVNPILTKAQEGGTLRDVLVAENTLHFTEDNSTLTLTPLGLAIHRDSDECIDPILTKAQEGGILQEVLDAENTLDTDILSTSELYKAANRNKADIKSRLGNVSIAPRLQENSRT